MYALGFIAAAVAAGLAVILPVWAAILIVGVLLSVAAAVLAMAGRRAHPNGAGGGGADPRDLEGGRPMGEAADRKVTEIEETRRRLEADLRELEARIPAPLRSVKSVAGLLGGSALGALVLRQGPVQALERAPLPGGRGPRRPRRRVSGSDALNDLGHSSTNTRTAIPGVGSPREVGGWWSWGACTPRSL